MKKVLIMLIGVILLSSFSAAAFGFNLSANSRAIISVNKLTASKIIECKEAKELLLVTSSKEIFYVILDEMEEHCSKYDSEFNESDLLCDNPNFPGSKMCIIEKLGARG